MKYRNRNAHIASHTIENFLFLKKCLLPKLNFRMFGFPSVLS